MVGLLHAVPESGQGLPLNEPSLAKARRTDGNCWQQLKHFLSGVGLQLEESFEIPAIVMGSYRVRY
jgi:hypothetical protein